MGDLYEHDLSDQYYTPAWIRSRVHRAFRGPPDLDPATSRRNPLRARHFYTVGALGKRWGPCSCCFHGLSPTGHPPDRARPGWRIWLNPPYGRRVGDWTGKLLTTLCEQPGCEALLLVGARSGARWYAVASRMSQLRIELDGRLTFEDERGEPCEDQARWGSALMYYGHRAAAVRRAFAGTGLMTRFSPAPPWPGTTDDADQRQLRLVLGGNETS